MSKSNKPYGTMKIMDFTGKQTVTIFENQLNIIDGFDLTQPIGIVGRVEKEEIVTETEDGQEDKDCKINIRVFGILNLESCKEVDIKIRKDKGDKQTKHAKKKSLTSKQYSQEAVSDEFLEYEQSNHIEPLDLRADMNDRHSCLCVLLDGLISHEQVSMIANLAREHSGNTKLAIGFRNAQTNKAFILESNLSVNTTIKPKLEKILPNVQWQLF